MNRAFRPAVIVATLLALAVGIVACGSDDASLLPGNTAEEIIENLEQINDYAAAGECDAAESAVDEVSGQIEALPSSVDERLRRNLMNGVERLRTVIQESCGEDVESEEPDPDTEAAEEEPTDEAVDPNTDSDTGREPNAERPGAGRDRTPPRGQGGGNQGRGADPGGPTQPGGDRPPTPRTPTPDPPAPEPDDSGGISPEEADSPSSEGTP